MAAIVPARGKADASREKMATDTISQQEGRCIKHGRYPSPPPGAATYPGAIPHGPATKSYSMTEDAGQHGPTHRPFSDLNRIVGRHFTVACRDCSWTQLVDDDLHDDEAYSRLFAWHIAHPELGFDHLAGPPPGAALKVADYIRWADNGFGGLMVVDDRTEGIYSRYNHASLAIFTALSVGGSLQDAAISEGRRLGISPPRRARSDIDAVLLALYYAGLLQPA